MYNEYQRQRLQIKPGLTCYWQTMPHRNNIPFDEWVELDLKYIRVRSFFVDWKIIFSTVVTVWQAYGEQKNYSKAQNAVTGKNSRVMNMLMAEYSYEMDMEVQREEAEEKKLVEYVDKLVKKMNITAEEACGILDESK